MLRSLFHVHLRRILPPTLALVGAPTLLLLGLDRLDWSGSLPAAAAFGDLQIIDALLLLTLCVLAALLGARAFEPATRHLPFLRSLPVRRWACGLVQLTASLLAFSLAIGLVAALHPVPLFASALMYVLPGLLFAFLAAAAASFLPLPSLLSALLGLAASGALWLNLINATFPSFRGSNANPVLEGLGGWQTSVFEIFEGGLKSAGMYSFPTIWTDETYSLLHLGYGVMLCALFLLCLRLYATAEPASLRGKARSLGLFLGACLCMAALPWGLRLASSLLLERQPWRLTRSGGFNLAWNGQHAAFFELKSNSMDSLVRASRLLVLDTGTGKLTAEHRLDGFQSLKSSRPSGIFTALLQEVSPWSWLSFRLVRFSAEGAPLGSTPLPLDSVAAFHVLPGDRLLLAGMRGDEAVLLSFNARSGKLEPLASTRAAILNEFGDHRRAGWSVLIARDAQMHVQATWRVEDEVRPLRLPQGPRLLNNEDDLYNRFVILEDRFFRKPSQAAQFIAERYGPPPGTGGVYLFRTRSLAAVNLTPNCFLFYLATDPKTNLSSLYVRPLQGSWRPVLLDMPVVLEGDRLLKALPNEGLLSLLLEERGAWRPYLYDAALNRLQALDIAVEPYKRRRKANHPAKGRVPELFLRRFLPSSTTKVLYSAGDCDLILEPGQPEAWSFWSQAPGLSEFMFAATNETGRSLWFEPRGEQAAGDLILEEPDGTSKVLWPRPEEPNSSMAGGNR